MLLRTSSYLDIVQWLDREMNCSGITYKNPQPFLRLQNISCTRSRTLLSSLLFIDFTDYRNEEIKFLLIFLDYNGRCKENQAHFLLFVTVRFHKLFNARKYYKLLSLLSTQAHQLYCCEFYSEKCPDKVWETDIVYWYLRCFIVPLSHSVNWFSFGTGIKWILSPLLIRQSCKIAII